MTLNLGMLVNVVLCGNLSIITMCLCIYKYRFQMMGKSTPNKLKHGIKEHPWITGLVSLKQQRSHLQD
nr:hypothetical protein [Tanacetum cinerariifolium]